MPRQQVNYILQPAHETEIPEASYLNYSDSGALVVKKFGLIELCLRTSHTIPNIMVLMNIFTVNVTARFGLDVLDAECLYAKLTRTSKNIYSIEPTG